MNIPLDEVIYFDCITCTPSTGAAVDADSTPTFAVYEEATDTDIGIGGNLTKRTSLTGNYRGTFTLSAANGFEVGKWYSIIGSAVVGGVTGKAVLKNFRCVAAEAIAGSVEVNVKSISGDATAADNAEAFFDGTGYAGTGNVIPTVTTATNVTTVNGLAANVITAASIATDAITDAKVASDVTIASVTGAVGSVTGAVGSVTGNVGGNVVGSVASVVGLTASNLDVAVSTLATASNLAIVAGYLDTEIAAIKAKTDNLPASPASTTNITAATGITVSAIDAGVITAASIATDAINADALAADAVTEIWAKAMTELTSVPGVSGTVLQALTWVFELSRNKVTQTATTQIVMRDDGTTTLGTSTVSDDGTTFSRGEFA